MLKQVIKIFGYFNLRENEIDFNTFSFIIFFLLEDFLLSHKEHTLEIHKIKTEDGYILTAWRILPLDPKLNALARSREPVMLVHGLMDCSISWFLNKERHLCLPYILAD